MIAPNNAIDLLKYMAQVLRCVLLHTMRTFHFRTHACWRMYHCLCLTNGHHLAQVARLQLNGYFTLFLYFQSLVHSFLFRIPAIVCDMVHLHLLQPNFTETFAAISTESRIKQKCTKSPSYYLLISHNLCGSEHHVTAADKANYNEKYTRITQKVNEKWCGQL